jgi:SAM-dependent methyltransferase
MDNNTSEEYAAYFNYLKGISPRGRAYKRFFASPLLFLCARRFGSRVIEVGCGTGSGVLGTFSQSVIGLDINPFAVEFCNSKGFRAFVIEEDGRFPLPSDSSDVCVLDNVLEHIEQPRRVFDECYRVTSDQGGLVVVVPGVRGYDSDPDHKLFYNEDRLRGLDNRWRLMWSFSIPFLFKSQALSQAIKQYCLVAVYKKARLGSLSQ